MHTGRWCVQNDFEDKQAKLKEVQKLQEKVKGEETQLVKEQTIHKTYCDAAAQYKATLKGAGNELELQTTSRQQVSIQQTHNSHLSRLFLVSLSSLSLVSHFATISHAVTASAFPSIRIPTVPLVRCRCGSLWSLCPSGHHTHTQHRHQQRTTHAAVVAAAAAATTTTSGCSCSSLHRHTLPQPQPKL